jgi:Domain of unknown function (DUF222)
VDDEQIRVIDRVARRVTEPHTLAALDEQAVEAAQTRSPKQLRLWLLRLVVRLEPLAFEQRHRRALEERRVTVVQGVDGLGYVTGEVSAADAAAIDGLLAATARSLGADDPRTEQQRRSDLFADLLLGRLAFDQSFEETVMIQPMSPIGLKSRTLTLKPAGCLAPNCNASTGMVSRSVNLSMQRRKCFQVTHTKAREASPKATDWSSRATRQPARR